MTPIFHHSITILTIFLAVVVSVAISAKVFRLDEKFGRWFGVYCCGLGFAIGAIAKHFLN